MRSRLPAALLGAGLLCAAAPSSGVRAEGMTGGTAGTAVGPGAAAPALTPPTAAASRVRLEITGVDAGAEWTTVHWRLTDLSTGPTGRAAAVPDTPRPEDPRSSDPRPDDPRPDDPRPDDPRPDDPRPSNPRPSNPRPSNPRPDDPRPADPRPSDPGARIRMVSGPGRTVYHPLVDGAGRCMCSRLAGPDLPPGRAVAGFATFPALPPAAVPVRTVRVEVPAYGFSREVPVRPAGAGRPAARPDDDATGFTVEGIDRLPYATVLRVRKRPTRPDQVPLIRPQRLATSPGAPLAAGEVLLVDPVTRTAATPRYGPRRCMCADFTAGTGRDGSVRGVYVFPYVPAARRLRVWFTGGLPVDDVPVRDVEPPPTGARDRATPAWPQPVWPAERPAEREVATYPGADRVAYTAVTERPSAHREETARQVRSSVLFGVDSAVPGPAALSELRELARQITDRPGIKGVQIAGYADPPGDAGYNQRLSERRARAVADLLVRLVARADVAFIARGYGEAPARITPAAGGDGGAGSAAGSPAGSAAGAAGGGERAARNALNRNVTITLPR